jgi:putative aldouronate transport system permease protein
VITTSRSKFNRYRARAFVGRSLVHLALLLFSLVCLIPMVLIVSISLSSERAVAINGFSLLPQEFTTYAYEYVLKVPAQLLRAYGVTALITVVGTSVGLLTASMLAYVISRRDFALRGPLSFYVFFTMLFSGGLIPTYILVTRYLHLKDNLLALILPYLVVPYLVLILRTYFSQLPHEIMEAATMDGAGEWRTFFQIVVPLSTPSLATVGLFYLLMYWNDWFLALLYIDNQNLVPLQYLLYKLMANIAFLASNPQTTGVSIPIQPARMSMAVLAAGPAVFAFLLVQRYFVRGIVIGSLKG